ncbi:MAG: hypothetical protein GXX10_09265 [Clostridiaceae bacterium]|nr:hypothetical protein [Clostridiaceae bacterium]
MQKRFSFSKKLLVGTLLCFFVSLVVHILNSVALRITPLSYISIVLTFLSMFSGLILAIHLKRTAASVEENLIYRYMGKIKEKLGSVHFTPNPSFQSEHIVPNPATKWNHANVIKTSYGFEGVYGQMPYKAYELSTLYHNGTERPGSLQFNGYYIIAEKPLSCRKEISVRTNNYFHPHYMREDAPHNINNHNNQRIKTYYPFKTQIHTFDTAFKCLFADESDVSYLANHRELCLDLAVAAGKTSREFSVFISPDGFIALSIWDLSFRRMDSCRGKLSFEERFTKTLNELSFFMDLMLIIYTQLE